MTEKDKKHFNIRIFGQVQDVNFRYYATAVAKKLNLTGFVRNDSNGSVYVEAEGAEETLQQLLNWCKKGPAWAKVEKVEITEGPLKKFSDFKISY